jgi:hypothetical protein
MQNYQTQKPRKAQNPILSTNRIGMVYSCYVPPMILLCGSSTPSQRLQGLNLTPKSEIRGVAGARTEGIWPGDALQGLAGGQSADTSPVQVFRTC